MSKPTSVPLANGSVAKSDAFDVELHQPPDAPSFVLVRWPTAPSVLTPDPRALAELARAIVRVLAAAQTRLATIQAAER